jgi:ATP-dependent exoDNAse (exonuclease V) beta subunit
MSIIALFMQKSIMAEYATALRDMGLSVKVEAMGWFEEPMIQVLYHAMAYLSDPSESHAALYLAVTELGENSLESALKGLSKKGEIDDRILKALDDLRPSVDVSPVDMIARQTVDALGLFDIVSEWEDGDQVRANIIRFLNEARQFTEANKDALGSGGFYGTSLKTFLAWLQARAEADGTQPDARYLDENAVELSTWHSAKGREWPVVFVCGTNVKQDQRFPHFDITYAGFSDLDSIIDKAHISVWPSSVIPEKKESFKDALWAGTHEEMRRLWYVALTRARERLIIQFQAERSTTGTMFWDVLYDATGIGLVDKGIQVGKQVFPCKHHLMSAQGGISIKKTPKDVFQGRIGRSAIRRGASPNKLTPEFARPSDVASGKSLSCRPKVISYAGSMSVSSDLSSMDFGKAMHKAFEILCQRPDAIDSVDRVLNKELSHENLEQAQDQARQFMKWVNDYLTPTDILYETPIIGINYHGSVVSGVMDMLIMTGKGAWIIDHKIEAVSSPKEVYRSHLPQLRSYADILASVVSLQ